MCYSSLPAVEDVRPIVSVDSSVASIAVDYNLRVLFWLESYPKARLRTSSLSGRGVTTLSSRDFFQPISLTIDSTEGYFLFLYIYFRQSVIYNVHTNMFNFNQLIFNICIMSIYTFCPPKNT